MEHSVHSNYCSVDVCERTENLYKPSVLQVQHRGETHTHNHSLCHDRLIFKLSKWEWIQLGAWAVGSCKSHTLDALLVSESVWMLSSHLSWDPQRSKVGREGCYRQCVRCCHMWGRLHLLQSLGLRRFLKSHKHTETLCCVFVTSKDTELSLFRYLPKAFSFYSNFNILVNQLIVRQLLQTTALPPCVGFCRQSWMLPVIA